MTSAWSGGKTIADVVKAPANAQQIAVNKLQAEARQQTMQLAQAATAKRQNAAALVRWLDDHRDTHPHGGPTYKRTMTYEEIQEAKTLWANKSTTQLKYSSRGPTKKGKNHVSADCWVANFEIHTIRGTRQCDLHAFVDPKTIPEEAKRNRGYGPRG